MVLHASEQPLGGVPEDERHLYLDRDAFGKLGVRTFETHVMEHPHWHGHVEANLLSGGSAVYQMDGEDTAIPEGWLTFFWAGVPHRISALEKKGAGPIIQSNLYLPADAFLFMPNIAEVQVAILGGAIVGIPTHLFQPAQMERWQADYRSGDFERQEVLKAEVNALIRRAAIEGLTFFKAPRMEGRHNRVSNVAQVHHVVAMLRFILDNLGRSMTNADIAAVTGLHENYALSLFSRAMHMPPKRFVIRMRLLHARSMLIDGSAAISVVADESGFSSITQFYHHFQTAYGMSPHAFRVAHRS